MKSVSEEFKVALSNIVYPDSKIGRQIISLVEAYYLKPESLAGVREALEELLTKIPIDKAFNNVYLPGFYEAVEKGKAALGNK